MTKTKDGGGFILSWEQGGGKTLGAAGYALGAVRNGARNQVLFIVPQDLIPQYRQDIWEKLGIEVQHITTPAHARRVAKHLRAGGEGWYITHYEVLSLLGVKNEPLPVQTSASTKRTGERVVLDSSEFCPACHASHHDGWQKDSPLVCSAVHTEEVRAKSAAEPAATSTSACGSRAPRTTSPARFADGVICIDEGTLIKGDESQRSKAIRGLQARNRLLATGTPISNYVNQIFWLMWWCLGDSSLRFPYSYRRRARHIRARLLRGRVHLRPRGIGDRPPAREAQGAAADHQRQPLLAAVGRGDDPPAQARLRRADRPVHPEDRARAPMGVAQHELYKHWLNKSHLRVVLRVEVPRAPAGAERADRAVRRRMWAAHEARVRHDRARGGDRPRLAGTRRT